MANSSVFAPRSDNGPIPWIVAIGASSPDGVNDTKALLGALPSTLSAAVRGSLSTNPCCANRDALEQMLRRQSWPDAGPRWHPSSFASACDPSSSRSRSATLKSWCGSIEARSCRASCPIALPSQRIVSARRTFGPDDRREPSPDGEGCAAGNRQWRGESDRRRPCLPDRPGDCNAQHARCGP